MYNIEKNTIDEELSYFNKVFSAYVFYLDAIYDTNNDDEILVFWECLNKLLSVYGGLEILNEFIVEGNGKYKVIQTKLRKLNLF